MVAGLLLVLLIVLATRYHALKKTAYYDPITGLPNRTLFYILLQKALRQKNPLVVLVFDIDNFKQVNDTFGHSIGDVLLKHIGVNLQRLGTSHDVVARLSGDEFVMFTANKVVLLPNVLQKPLVLDSQTITYSMSFGSSKFPQDGSTVHDLLHIADLAMYQMKKTQSFLISKAGTKG